MFVNWIQESKMLEHLLFRFMLILTLALHRLLELHQFLNPTNWTIRFWIALPQSRNTKIENWKVAEILGMLEVLNMSSWINSPTWWGHFEVIKKRQDLPLDRVHTSFVQLPDYTPWEIISVLQQKLINHTQLAENCNLYSIAPIEKVYS
jgi:hypothetical protein